MVKRRIYQFFSFLSVRASEGGRVARVVKKGTYRYKILRALTILVRRKEREIPKKNISRVGAWLAYAKRGRHIKKNPLSLRAFEGGAWPA